MMLTKSDGSERPAVTCDFCLMRFAEFLGDLFQKLKRQLFGVRFLRQRQVAHTLFDNIAEMIGPIRVDRALGRRCRLERLEQTLRLLLQILQRIVVVRGDQHHAVGDATDQSEQRLDKIEIIYESVI